MIAGIARNFEVYDPLDFLAEVTRHIPNKGEHPIRYYGHDSNKKLGMQEKKKPGEPKQSIELLLSLGLIKKNDEGCFKPTDKVLTTGDVVRDELLQCYQIANHDILRSTTAVYPDHPFIRGIRILTSWAASSVSQQHW